MPFFHPHLALTLALRVCVTASSPSPAGRLPVFVGCPSHLDALCVVLDQSCWARSSSSEWPMGVCLCFWLVHSISSLVSLNHQPYRNGLWVHTRVPCACPPLIAPTISSARRYCGCRKDECAKEYRISDTLGKYVRVACAAGSLCGGGVCLFQRREQTATRPFVCAHPAPSALLIYMHG